MIIFDFRFAIFDIQNKVQNSRNSRIDFKTMQIKV